MYFAIIHHPELPTRTEPADTLDDAQSLASAQPWQGDPPVVHGPDGEVWRATWDDDAQAWAWASQ